MPTYFFGRRWDAPMVENAQAVRTPIGQQCLDCGEPIEAGDRGLIVRYVREANGQRECVMLPIHLECSLRDTMSHTLGECHCFKTHPTLRAEARATLVAVNARRAADGRGPL